MVSLNKYRYDKCDLFKHSQLSRVKCWVPGVHNVTSAVWLSADTWELMVSWKSWFTESTDIHCHRTAISAVIHHHIKRVGWGEHCWLRVLVNRSWIIGNLNSTSFWKQHTLKGLTFVPFNMCVADKGLYHKAEFTIYSAMLSELCRQLAKLKGQTEPITFYGRSENCSVN